MKTFAIGARSLSFFFALLAALGLACRMQAQATPPEGSRQPVVVELFTSEGCSSCPPADVLLQKLQAQQPVAAAEIIPLEEHVDYWNHDGWVDPFSSPDWTERQASYVSLEKKDPYSPEIVVDGRSQFVGNNPHHAVVEIEKATHTPKAEVAVKLATTDGNGAARFNVTVGKIDDSKHGDAAEVWLAVTEDGLHSSVSRGENAGHVLQHVATLRSLKKIGVADAGGAQSFTGDPEVKFDSHWSVENLHVTVFVQKKKSREIVGAASVKVKG